MIRIAINQSYTDKLNQATSKELWRDFNGSFTNVELPPFAVMMQIIQGYAYTTQHERYRKAENFICGQHLATDHDTGDSNSSIAVLAEHPFVKEHAYAIYTTPSHTEESPRARVIYFLDEPIFNPDGYARLASALCYHFEDADPSTKDACRIFFGNSKATFKILGNILPLGAAKDKLMRPYFAHLQRQPVLSRSPVLTVSSVSDALAEAILNRELDKISQAPDGEKYRTLLRVSRTLGGYVASSILDYHQVKNALIHTISRRDIKSLDTAISGITSGLAHGMSQPLYVEVPVYDDFKDDLGYVCVRNEGL